MQFFRKNFGKYYEIYGILTCFVPDLTTEPKSRPMKLTVPRPFVLPIDLSNFTRVASISFPGRSYSNTSFNFFQTILALTAGTSRVRPFYRIARLNYFGGTINRVHSLVFDGLNHDTTVNVLQFANECSSLALIAGQQISFRTQPSITSVELLSLTTGPCSVRVKNKAAGQATLLLSVKI